jgi:methionyl-tRNA formyltransferase
MVPMPPPLPTDKPRLIFAGGGAFGLPTLQRLLEAGYPIVQVVTQPDRPAGRGRKLAATPVAELAQQHRLPLLRTPDINRQTLADADLLLVIAFGQKISQSIIHRPPLGSLNLHASLLPQYRGAAPIHWAIIRGETFTGNSIIRLAERMDAGAVLGQSRLEIGEVETTGELHDRLAIDGAGLVLRVIEQLAAGTAREQPQEEALATLAPKLHRSDAHLDWTRPAGEIARRIRGLSPWPGCHVHLTPADAPPAPPLRLSLLRARAVAATGDAPPGQIDPAGHIATAHGAVELLDVQPEGKRPMPMPAYRNGHPWPIGASIESA